MTPRSIVARFIVIALVVSLLGLCVADVVHASMPRDGGPMDCGTQLCNEASGCGPTGVVVLHGLPVAGLLPVVDVTAPSVTTSTAIVADLPPPVLYRVLPRAPRSPPVA